MEKSSSISRRGSRSPTPVPDSRDQPDSVCPLLFACSEERRRIETASWLPVPVSTPRTGTIQSPLGPQKFAGRPARSASRFTVKERFPHGLSGSGSQISSAAVSRRGRPGPRDADADECARAESHCAWIHFLRASRDWENDHCPHCRQGICSPERPTPEPCGVCDSCVEIRQGNAVDVIEIDAATNRGIDEIRELRDAARYRPARDRYKIYILDEAHQITDAAFNALLKTLEEPPAHVIFMIATTEPENIPQTIRSRCQHFSFHAVKFDDILAQLRMIAVQEQVEAEDAALALLAEAGDGSMRDALSIMDQAIASAPCDAKNHPVLSTAQIRELMGAVPNAVFERLLEAVAAGQSAQLMEQLNVLLN